MVAPLIIVGGAIAFSVATGYFMEKTVGDGHYSGTDLAVDAGVGALGGGVIGPVAKITSKGAVGLARYGTRASKFGRHSDEATDAAIYAASAMSNPKNLRPIGVSLTGELTKVGIGATQSSGRRSEQNGSNVRPGGKNRAKTVPPSVRGVALKRLLRKEGYGKVARDICPKGYKLVRTKTGFVCQLK